VLEGAPERDCVRAELQHGAIVIRNEAAALEGSGRGAWVDFTIRMGGRDYHEVLWEKLNELAKTLGERFS